MTKKKFYNLKPGDRVRWTEQEHDETLETFTVDGVVKETGSATTSVGGFILLRAIFWSDGEKLPINGLHRHKAKYIRKIRD